jgi:transposase
MSNEIHPDYSHQFLLPPNIEDWVPIDHPARFIRFFVDSIDLPALGFIERKSEEGRPNYSNNLLLKIWLYGYFEKLYSTRGLEKACKDRFALVWLTGLNYPDHNTIWRFFDKNRTVIKQVFSQSVQVALKGDLVGLVLQAIDGTKIFADVSKNRSVYLKDLRQLLNKLDTSIDEVLAKISSQEVLECGDSSYGLPSEYQDKRKLKRLIDEGLDELSSEKKQELKRGVESEIEKLESEGVNQLNLTDRDARLMKTSGGSKSFCYNAQVAVDAESQIIVGSKVSSEPSDNHLLTEMIEESASNTGRVCDESLADGGYFSGKQLQEAKDKGYGVLVNMSDKDKGKNKNKIFEVPSDKEGEVKILDFSKRAFLYDEARDIYICPMKKELPFERVHNNSSKGYAVRSYRCKHHKGCKYKEFCSKEKRGRCIERSPYEKAVEEQVKKQEDGNNRWQLRKRMHIVEPVFGWIKSNNKFFRWTYWGHKSVEAQWQLICTVINLKILYRKWLADSLNLEVVLGKPG